MAKSEKPCPRCGYVEGEARAMLTLREAARELGCTLAQVKSLVEAGVLLAFSVDGRKRVARKNLKWTVVRDAVRPSSRRRFRFPADAGRSERDAVSTAARAHGGSR